MAGEIFETEEAPLLHGIKSFKEVVHVDGHLGPRTESDVVHQQVVDMMLQLEPGDIRTFALNGIAYVVTRIEKETKSDD